MAEDINIKIQVDTSQANQSTESYKKKLKDLVAQMTQLQLETDGLSKASEEQRKRFAQLSAEAGKIKDAMGDAQQQASNLADDYRGMSAALQGVQGAVGGITAVTGAMNLLGADSEGAAEAVKKVTSLMGVLQGVQSVQKALNKDSQLMSTISELKNKLLTKSIVTQTAAQKALNLAKLGAIGAITGLVAAIGTLIYKYASAKNAAADLTKEINKQAAEAVADNVVKVKDLAEAWDKLGGDLKKQEEFLVNNREELEGMGLAFNDVNEAEEFFRNQTDNYVKAITARAKAEAVRAKIVDETKAKLDAEMEAERVASGELTFWEDAAIKLGTTNLETLTAVADEEVKSSQKAIDILEKKAKKYEEEAAEAEKVVSALKKKAEAEKKAEEEAKKAEEERLRLAKEAAERAKKEREERIALTQKELADLDKFVAEQTKAHNTTLQNIDAEELAITDMYDKALDSAIKYYGEESVQVMRITELRTKALEDLDKKRKEILDKQAKDEEERAQKEIRDAEDTQNRVEKAKLEAQLVALDENSAQYYAKKKEIDLLAEEEEKLALERRLSDNAITYDEYLAQYDLIVANHSKTRADLEIAEAEKAQQEIAQIEQKKWQFAEDLVKNYQNIISAAMEAELEAVGDNEEEQKRVRKKYAKAQFIGQIASIGISTAKAIMETWSAYAEIPFVGTALAAAQSAVIAALGVAQAVNAKQQMNTALKAEKGGILQGKSHAQGGIMLSNGVEAEGGEAIINKRSTSMFAPILSEINSYNGYGAPLIKAQPTNNNTSSSLVTNDAIKQIVKETIAGVTAIPVIVSEHNITEAQRQVGITRERAFI